jgi:hypothetical protein
MYKNQNATKFEIEERLTRNNLRVIALTIFCFCESQ